MGRGMDSPWSLLTYHSWISQFSFGNSSHVECPHQTGELISDPGWDALPPLNPYPTGTKPGSSPVLTSLTTTTQILSPPANRMSPMIPFPTLAAPSWNVSMDTQGQQLVLHISSRIHATFSAAWSHPSLGQDSLVPPVYSISQVWPSQGSNPLPPTSTVLLLRAQQVEADKSLTYIIWLFIYLTSLCSAGSSVSGGFMEQFLILLVSELTPDKVARDQRSHIQLSSDHSVCCHILYQGPLSDPAVLYPCLSPQGTWQTFPILGGRAPRS